MWRMLADGVDAVAEVPPGRWSLDELYDDNSAAPGKMNTRWGGFLADIDRFDAAFFGISPREAAHIDPQQRLLMEVAWEALEDAGIPADTLAGQAVGVFLGISSYDYGSRQLTRYDEIRDGYVNTGSALSIAANRISYLLDLRGPSLVIDTACSSSLVAAYYACESVRRGESRIALAGGVNIILSPAVTIGFSKLQAMAPDGRCKAFDARANGYVRGEGAGVVVLKPLESALLDGDRIYAVIRGGSINQDGRTNGLTAPNGLSQEALIRDALSSAGIGPSDLQYVEAHGTGTALGDPIELNALGAVLAAGRNRDSRCAVGSAKTNFGHLEAAAGVAALIKLALSLQHRQLPPSLHFETPNPYIRFDVLPLRVVTSLEPWPAAAGPARGGVSSFGFGGTNAHLVLEEPPSRTRPEAGGRGDDPSLLVVSARSEQALCSLAAAYAQRLEEDDTLSLVDFCATAALRRSHHAFRLAAVAASRSELASKLRAFVEGERPKEVEAGKRVAGRRRKLAFVFPGQGSQWLGMGRELSAREPVFADAIEQCAAAFAEHVEWSLIDELEAPEETSRLAEVDVVQPAIFAIQVALAALWRSWGVKPDAVVGHSMGEIAAAHVAGALSLADASRIICLRSRLARRTSGRGAMAVVDLSFSKATELIAGHEDRLAVAVSNSPTSSVLSGDPDALEEVLARLERDGVFCRRVKVDYASHSPQMDPLRNDLLAVLNDVTPRRTQVPLYSTVTQTIAPGRDLGAEYWVRNLREPVMFSGSIEKLLEDGIDVFLEVSPHPILLPAIRQCLLHFEREGLALGSLRRDEGERRSLLSTLASLYTIGKSVEWGRLYPAAECVQLPTYPWQRERFWFEDEIGLSAGMNRARVKSRNPLIGEHVRSAMGPATHLWQREVGTNAFPFLNDHRVQGEIVVPATAYLEMALEAGHEALGEGAAFTVENVRFEKALVLSENEARDVQVILTRQIATRFEWQVFGAIAGPVVDGAATFARHARGDLRVADDGHEQAPAMAESLAEIRARCTTEISGADHYRLMAERQLNYGPSFQGVEWIHSGTGEAIARLKSLSARTGGYQIHPALLDSALQVLGAAVTGGEPQTLVPISIDRVRLEKHAGLSGALWAHAVWNSGPPHVSGNVRLLTEAGELVADLRGIALEPLDASISSENEVFYTLAWEKGPSTTGDAELEHGAAFLIFADSSGVGARLAEEITARGGLAIVVMQGTSVEVPDDLIETRDCRIDPARADDYAELLQRLERRRIALDGVVHLWSLDAAEDASDAFALGCGSALLLLQALGRNTMEIPPRVWLTTRTAQRVLDDDQVSLFAAPLWGFARTVAQEHPELTCTVIDLAAVPSAVDSAALMGELVRRDSEQQVAFRNGDRFVARLAALERSALGAHTFESSIASDGTATPFSVQIREPGNLSSVAFRQIARRRPAPGEVEIAVAAAGLNFLDVFLALGLLPAEGEVVLGHECSGTIAAVGDGVTQFAVGDQVVALARHSLSSFVRTPASLVVRKPAHLDLDEAATLPIALLTAYYSLSHLGRLQPNDRVLIHSATGGVGLACVRLAQELGAEIYATAGTEEKRRFLQSLGVQHVMDSRSLDFAAEVMERTKGAGVDVVVNSLAGEALARSLSVLAPGGRFIELGKRDRFEGGQLPLQWLAESRSFFLVDLNSMAEKRPAMCGELLREALHLFEAKKFAPLPKRVFPVPEFGDALHHMARARHIGKVIVRMDRGSVPVETGADASVRVRDDATYVLTGGLGGVALVVAQWLIQKGARTLVLVGRNEPSLEAQAAISVMEQAGARVVVDHFDVAHAASVDAAFARWSRELPRVRGVVHAAGVLDDGILLQQTPARFHRVMRPKVDGAWNFHRASLDCPLDFFLLFSSAASVLGSAGQSNYAAANQFLDALAHYRRARGLAAVSINWGPWSEVGLAARPDRGGRLAVSGIKSLSPAEALKSLEQILLSDASQVAAMRVDWQAWRTSYPLFAQMPFFSRTDGAASARTEMPHSVRADVLAASPDARVALVVDCLRQHVSTVLRIAASKIDVDQTLLAMGIDSLMAVELKSGVERELGVTIPLLQLIKGPSVAELARSLVVSMTGHLISVPEAQTPALPDRATGKSLLQSILSLKDSEISATPGG